jgi:hypothetical protein
MHFLSPMSILENVQGIHTGLAWKSQMAPTSKIHRQHFMMIGFTVEIVIFPCIKVKENWRQVPVFTRFDSIWRRILDLMDMVNRIDSNKWTNC